MKKRTWPLILILTVLSMAVLASCGHEHAYSWKSDSEKHWQECECGDKKDEGAHVDENGDDTCDVCEYNMHAHAYSWQSDANKHWQACGCGDKKDEGAHVDAINNQTSAKGADDLCDVCGRKATVRFNMLGHGTAPAAQYIELGGGPL